MSAYRTGLPHFCPAWRYAFPTCGAACTGCLWHLVDDRAHWRCDHPGYQQAKGIHFCRGCGRELGPYAERHGWEWCGGPQGRCLDPGSAC